MMIERDPYRPPVSQLRNDPVVQGNNVSALVSPILGLVSLILPVGAIPVGYAFGFSSPVARAVPFGGIILALAGIMLGCRGANSNRFIVAMVGLILSILGLIWSGFFSVTFFSWPGPGC